MPVAPLATAGTSLAPASAAVIETVPDVIGVSGVCGMVVMGVVPVDVPGTRGVVPGAAALVTCGVALAMHAPSNSSEAIEVLSGARRVEVMSSSM
jgi:hypothetical protein